MHMKESNKLETFGDWFGGIGAFRIALESRGLRCVFGCEISPNARTTYLANFGELPSGDIRGIPISRMPPQDVITGGWPCQSVSLSGRMEGMADPRGDLVMEVVRAAREMVPQPKVILLENSSNLPNVDDGRMMADIKAAFDAAGYHLHWKILRACDYGAPTIRTRTYMVCLHKGLGISRFDFPEPVDHCLRLKDILLPDAMTERFVISRDDVVLDLSRERPLPDGTWPLDTIGVGHIRTGECQDEVIYSVHGVAPTLTYVGGKTSFIYVKGKVRRPHPAECLKIMGFPSTYRLICTDRTNHALLGNSACPPVISAIFRQIQQAVGDVSFDDNQA